MLNVLDFKTAGSQTRTDTEAIQAAIESASSSGGGTVLVPAPHTFHVDAGVSIQLKSDVHLLIEGGARLRAEATTLENSAVIRGDNVSNVSITGSGVIEGERSRHLITDVAIGSVDAGSKNLRLSPQSPTIFREEISDPNDPTKVIWPDHRLNLVIPGAGPNGSDLHTRVVGFNDPRNVILECAVSQQVTDAQIPFLRGEFGMGIQLKGVHHFTIRDVTVTDCWGDGIYIDGMSCTNQDLNQCRHWLIANVRVFYNRRSNLSIIAARDFRVRDSFLHAAGVPSQPASPPLHTGITGTRIVPPPRVPRRGPIRPERPPIGRIFPHYGKYGLIGAQSGIHIEPHFESSSKQWYVEEGVISGNSCALNGYDGIHIISPLARFIDVHGNQCFENRYINCRGGKASGVHICRPGPGITVHHNVCRRNDIGLHLSGSGQAGSPHDMGGLILADNACSGNDEDTRFDGHSVNFTHTGGGAP